MIRARLHVKRHARYEYITGARKGMKVVAYVASELVVSTEVLMEEDNMVVVKVGDLEHQLAGRSDESETRISTPRLSRY